MDEGREMMDGKGLRLEAEGRRKEAIGERRWGMRWKTRRQKPVNDRRGTKDDGE
jgi:hypothetical protein